MDPVRDIQIINEELRLKDEEQLLAAIDKLGKTVLRGEKKDKPEYVICFAHCRTSLCSLLFF